MAKHIYKTKKRGSRQSMIIKPPFEQRANDARSFRDMHPGETLQFFVIFTIIADCALLII